jgi:hypothetical protein
VVQALLVKVLLVVADRHTAAVAVAVLEELVLTTTQHLDSTLMADPV